jgi:hypothetical protein
LAAMAMAAAAEPVSSARQGRPVDALAPGGDEGRGTLR